MFTRPMTIALCAISLWLTACGTQATPAPTAAPAATSTRAATVAAAATVPPAPTTARPAATAASTVPATTAATAAPTRVPAATAAAATLAPTAAAQFVPQMPACSGALPLTTAQTEGPYYTANTPQRASLLEPGIPGQRLLVTGYVLTSDCKPIAGAWLDFWQTDGNGAYDNDGYKLRGHQFTDAQGRYALETVMPGIYPGRTAHIHVKVRAPNGPELTSQIYFPGVARNATDGIFSPTLLATMQDNNRVAVFHFVVRAQ